MESNIDLRKADAKLMAGLQDLVNKMATDEELRIRAKDCYSAAMKLAKECYGEYYVHPLIQGKIQTYLAFVQTRILLDLRNGFLQDKKKK